MRATSLHAGTRTCGRRVEAGADARRRCARRAAPGTTAATPATAASSASRPTSPVTAEYAPSITIDAVMMLPSSTARSVAGTSTTVVRVAVERALEHRRVDEHQAARPQPGERRLREVVVHEDRRPRLGRPWAATRSARRRPRPWPRCCRRASSRRSSRTSAPRGPRRSPPARAPARRAGSPGRRCRSAAAHVPCCSQSRCKISVLASVEQCS